LEEKLRKDEEEKILAEEEAALAEKRKI